MRNFMSTEDRHDVTIQTNEADGKGDATIQSVTESRADVGEPNINVLSRHQAGHRGGEFDVKFFHELWDLGLVSMSWCYGNPGSKRSTQLFCNRV